MMTLPDAELAPLLHTHCSITRHLRSAQDGEGGAQGTLEGIVGPDEMHLLRDVSKLMIMEDKVFA